MKGNAIMDALGKAKGDSSKSANPPAPERDDEEDDALSVSKSQIAAAKAVRRAASDEDYAKALKAFFKLC